MLSGIPCCHALAAMRFLNLNVEEFIPHWFRICMYEETYHSIIYLVNGQLLWERTSYNDVQPTLKRRLLGRPKKKRRLEQWELKKNDTELRKGGHQKRCRVCREVGHNRSNCPQVPQQTQPTEQPPPPSSQQSTQSTQPTQQPPPQSSQQSTQATQPTQQPHEVSIQTGQPSTRQKLQIRRPTWRFFCVF